jgi:D-sedoheptulose 7-phosphate isomerase
MFKNDDRITFAQRYVDNLCLVLRNLPLSDLARALEIMEKAFIEQRQVFLAGNGGSAATASHMANDLMKSAAKWIVRGFHAIALSDNVPLITAIANDDGYDEIFANQLTALARPSDVLIVFSGSGESANIVRAVEIAQDMQITTIAFLGMEGGHVAQMADISIIVPSNEYGPIEDVHMMFNHLITTYLRSWIEEKQKEKG